MFQLTMMRSKSVRAVVLLCVISSPALATAETADRSSSPCKGQSTCGRCMQAAPDCFWCSDVEFKGDRCNQKEDLITQGCRNTTISTETGSVVIDKNEPVRDGSATESAVQISPQQITLNLRPNEPQEFEVTYRQANNYPVDLYYLMDLSNSMKDDKDKLAALGGKIADAMTKITTDFQLGFGSFVDKPVMPYTSTVPAKLRNPCTEAAPCDPPYSFQHHLHLQGDKTKFEEQVRAASVSGNLDSPEGGFDALMQAMVCRGEIGWRNVSRKLVIFSTDASFHYAGDGLLGGIVEPNDGQCHMTNNKYTESLNQDYPSISQVASAAAQNNINLIFAVTGSELNTYTKLSKLIQGSVYGELAGDSSNIVNLIADNYKKIASKVELRAETEADDVTTVFKTYCNGKQRRETSICENLNIGQEATFNVTVTASSCDTPNKRLVISPVGLLDKLVININMICSCQCEAPENEEPNSPHCNGTGTFECGSCTCPPDHYGSFCQCKASNLNMQDFDADCRKTNNSEVCEGHGTCVCGKCECNPVTNSNPNNLWTGAFCDCNNYNCPYFEGQPCGGPERGRCECSKCRCNERYNGTNCSCLKSKDKCIAKNGKECNGKGICECGKCKCTDKTHWGPTCEDCPTCPGACTVNADCVECKHFKTGDLSPEECEQNCSHVEDMGKRTGDSSLQKCPPSVDAQGCHFSFFYDSATGNVYYEKNMKKECPKQVNILWIVIGIIAGIILIGLIALIIWKVCVTIKDKREYERFEKERANAQWQDVDNPLYKQATSTFQNPAYAK